MESGPIFDSGWWRIHEPIVVLDSGVRIGDISRPSEGWIPLDSSDRPTVITH